MTEPRRESEGLSSANAAVDAVAQALAAQAGPVAAADLAQPAASIIPHLPDRDRSRGPRPNSSAFWRFGFPLIMVVLVALIPTLVYLGKQTVLRSADGQVVETVKDPAAPKWRAITDPTPTLLLVQTDSNGRPDGLTVLSLTGDGAGALIFVPMTTVLELADLGKVPLSVVADKQGLDGLQKATEGVLGLGMQEMSVVSPSQWADLVAPVGPLSFANPDDVTSLTETGQKRVVFAKGTITLDAKDAGGYLATLSPGENDLNRLVRHSAFWGAWLHKVGTSNNDNAVPGERASGFGRFVRALATDRVEAVPLPVQGASIPGSDAAIYLPVQDQLRPLVARLIPFPVGAPPGARPRVRLLDGVGTLRHGLSAAPLVVEGGGQIDQIGNADAFDVATTQLIYVDDARRGDVEKLRQSLGVGDIVRDPSGAATTDVTIILGKDFAAPPVRAATSGSSPASTTTIQGAPHG